VCAFVKRQDERITSVFSFFTFSFGHDVSSSDMSIRVTLALGKPASFGRLKIHTFRLRCVPLVLLM
jgi:hypothetical protein